MITNIINGNTKVNNMQQIYVKDGTVNTITATFDNKTSSAEIESVMQEVYIKRIQK